MRVVANNPVLNGQNAHQAEIDPATWRNVRLRMKKPDGGELLVTLLRSAEWRETQNAEPGNTIRLTFVELGIDGPADVLAVEACPIIESGTGRVVTGTFRHSAANVIDLYVTSDDQPIGTTANHPFWSETRQNFVQAGTLQTGEELRTATGASAHVRQLTPRSRSAEVFNLEVDAEHCYSVGRNGVVVHNSDNYDDGLPNVPQNTAKSISKFPDWGIGDSITKVTPEGNYPSWSTIRSRYWQNRAALDGGSFGPTNQAIMEKGFAPKARAIVRDRATAEIREILVEKELHHALGNRGVPGFDDPVHLREVWPWQHENLLPPGRRLDYDFIRFK